MPTTRTHLVPYVRTDILQPPLPASARPLPQPLRELLHLRPLLVGRLGEVDAVHGARASLDERERHLEPDPAMSARDERDAVCERELAREDRWVRWSTLGSDARCGGGRSVLTRFVRRRLERAGDADGVAGRDGVQGRGGRETCRWGRSEPRGYGAYGRDFHCRNHDAERADSVGTQSRVTR